MDKHNLPIPSRPPRRTAGFSLVEVALSIGIIAFAFVALFSLLPTGLQKFRESIDTASETWIMDGLNSMVQTTEWEKIYSKGGESELSKDIYYYDEEARLTDTKDKPSNDQKIIDRRLYAARLFVFPCERPATGSGKDNVFTRDGTRPVAVQVVAAMARIADRETMTALENLTAADIQNMKKDSRLRLKAFIATQMNAAK